MGFLFGFLLSFLSIFLILLVLVQRGRGGGLVGALGGPGGQSAFGSKAGDMFTWITISTAGLWALLCVGSVLWARSRQSFGDNLTRTTPVAVEGEDGNAEGLGAIDLGEQVPPTNEAEGGLDLNLTPPAASDEAEVPADPQPADDAADQPANESADAGADEPADEPGAESADDESTP